MDSAEELASEEAGWEKMGRHLRELRAARDWLQEDLEEASGVSVATIRAIENHKPKRRHTPRTLARISRALGEQDDYLIDYQKNPPTAEPSDKPETMRPAVPSRPVLGPVASRLDEIVVARLKEIVVPRLEGVEKQVHALVDVLFKTSGIEIDIKHPSDPE